MREAILRWLGHVERRTEEDVVIRTCQMGVDTKRWEDHNVGGDVVRKDMKEKGEKKHWRTWIVKTQCVDPE